MKCLRQCTGMCNDVAWRMMLKHLASYLTIMQWQYESDGTSHETEWWELHGNISQNGYENAIVGRCGGCFEEARHWNIQAKLYNENYH